MSTGSIDVYWLECAGADLPPDDRWLAESELRVLHAFRVPKRRHDWRLGRWTAKQAVAAFLRMPAGLPSLATIEIRPADSGAPEVFLRSGPAPVSISITHCNGMAACAVTAAGVAVGCDLEAVEPRSDAFVSDYFLECEQALIARTPSSDRPRLVTLLWSAKESALKVLHEGLRLDTRSVQARPDPSSTGDEWRPITVLASEGRRFRGWWQGDGRVIRTLITHPAPARPFFIRPW